MQKAEIYLSFVRAHPSAAPTLHIHKEGVGSDEDLLRLLRIAASQVEAKLGKPQPVTLDLSRVRR